MIEKQGGMIEKQGGMIEKQGGMIGEQGGMIGEQEGMTGCKEGWTISKADVKAREKYEEQRRMKEGIGGLFWARAVDGGQGWMMKGKAD